MEHRNSKAGRKINFRSKQEIIRLFEEYEVIKHTTSVAAFCKSNGVPSGTFYTWQKHQRQGKYPSQGKFIELSVEEPIEFAPPLPKVFASLCRCSVNQASSTGSSRLRTLLFQNR